MPDNNLPPYDPNNPLNNQNNPEGKEQVHLPKKPEGEKSARELEEWFLRGLVIYAKANSSQKVCDAVCKKLERVAKIHGIDNLIEQADKAAIGLTSDVSQAINSCLDTAEVKLLCKEISALILELLIASDKSTNHTATEDKSPSPKNLHEALSNKLTKAPNELLEAILFLLKDGTDTRNVSDTFLAIAGSQKERKEACLTIAALLITGLDASPQLAWALGHEIVKKFNNNNATKLRVLLEKTGSRIASLRFGFAIAQCIAGEGESRARYINSELQRTEYYSKSLTADSDSTENVGGNFWDANSSSPFDVPDLEGEELIRRMRKLQKKFLADLERLADDIRTRSLLASEEKVANQPQVADIRHNWVIKLTAELPFARNSPEVISADQVYYVDGPLSDLQRLEIKETVKKKLIF